MMRKTLITASVLAAIGLASAAAIADGPRGMRGGDCAGYGMQGGERQQMSYGRGEFRERMAQRAERRFESLDTDKDGALSREEAEAGYQARLQEQAERHQRRMELFGQADGNGDGKLSRDEMQAFRDQMREQWRDQAGSRMGGGYWHKHERGGEYRRGDGWQRGPGGPAGPAAPGTSSSGSSNEAA